MTSTYPGPTIDYAPGPMTTEKRKVDVNGKHLHVALPAGTEISLDLGTQRYVNEAGSGGPF